MLTKKHILHVLRNPYGKRRSEISMVALAAANIIEKIEDMEENAKEYSAAPDSEGHATYCGGCGYTHVPGTKCPTS